MVPSTPRSKRVSTVFGGTNQTLSTYETPTMILCGRGLTGHPPRQRVGRDMAIRTQDEHYTSRRNIVENQARCSGALFHHFLTALAKHTVCT